MWLLPISFVSLPVANSTNSVDQQDVTLFEMEIRQLQRDLYTVAVAYSRVAFDIAKGVGHIRLDAEAWSKRIFELHAWRVLACANAVSEPAIEVVEPNFC